MSSEYNFDIPRLVNAIMYDREQGAVRATINFTGDEYVEWSNLYELECIIRETAYQMPEEELAKFFDYYGIEY